ncbi:ras-related protein Rab-26-like [Oncorhynchus clarkii lewisi]|uniref:ras-related protein Rab-26-like n=1 Tax=Oncorhynchus clarkii lewisi TaxID=490388 RepID=UPI0039B87937
MTTDFTFITLLPEGMDGLNSLFPANMTTDFTFITILPEGMDGLNSLFRPNMTTDFTFITILPEGMDGLNSLFPPNMTTDAWLTEIHDYAQQDVVLMLLGNKADATQQRVVKREDGERLAKEFGVPYMETSAKSGLNVELSFTAVAKELKHRSMKEPNEPKFKLQDYVNKEMKSAGCAC